MILTDDVEARRHTAAVYAALTAATAHLIAEIKTRASVGVTRLTLATGHTKAEVNTLTLEAPKPFRAGDLSTAI